MGHAERKHSVLSPSSAHRWMECTPSALLEQQFPDTESDAAREGTLAHELAELKLRHYFFTVDFGKTKYTRAVNKLKKEELWKDEMDGYTEEYLDYVKGVALAFKSRPYVAVEKRVLLENYIPNLPDEEPAAGTADCVLIGSGELHIIDFKYGKGVPVSAEANYQLSLYALGVYDAYKILYPVETVYLHIVQPRIADGGSSWSCSLKQLLSFGEYAKGKAHDAILGNGDFHPSEKTCRFCKAKARCRARAEKNVELAFAVNKKPPLITNEEVGQYLKQGADIDSWLKGLKEYALAECLNGKEVPGWKAVAGRSNREWIDMDAAFEALKARGVPEEILWERKPLTLSQVESAVGKKQFAEAVSGYVRKGPGKPTLVEESDKREAITNRVTAEEAFKEETSNG